MDNNSPSATKINPIIVDIHMDDDMIAKVSAALTGYLVDAITKVFDGANCSIIEGDTIAPCSKIQWWYDAPFNTVFVFFDINFNSSEYSGDPKVLYTMTVYNVDNNLYRDLKVYPAVMEPATKLLEGKRVRNHYGTSDELRVNTFSYWYCGGRWRFLESDARLKYAIYKKYWKDKSYANIREFQKAVTELNKEYDFTFNNDEKPTKMAEAFGKFKELYAQYLESSLDINPIEEKDIHRINVQIGIVPPGDIPDK